MIELLLLVVLMRMTLKLDWTGLKQGREGTCLETWKVDEKEEKREEREKEEKEMRKGKRKGKGK